MNTRGYFAGLILIISSVSACASSVLTDREAYVIVDQILTIESYDGDAKAALTRYKQWGNLYTDYWQRVKGKPSDEDIKIYLLLIFAPYGSGSADTTEHIGETFLPVFEKNSSSILKILGNRQFLVETTCRAIGSSFDLADSKELAAKAEVEFLDRYKRLIVDALKRNGMDKKCLLKIGKIDSASID